MPLNPGRNRRENAVGLCDLTGIRTDMDAFDMALVALVVLVGLGFLLFELRARSLRTQVLHFPGELRFDAQNFSVQVKRSDKEIRVKCKYGLRKAPGKAADSSAGPSGPLEATFGALGYRVALRESVKQLPNQEAPIRLGHWEIEMRGADDSRLIIQKIPPPVAASFDNFAKQTRIWVEKLETRQRLAQQEQDRQAAEQAQSEQDARNLSTILADKPSTGPYTEEMRKSITQAQIAQWRKESGFEGKNTQYQVDPKGVVIWLIDLAPDGRVTLHANKKTLHTTLKGAVFAVLGGEMEVSVRDAFWSEESPALTTFRVLRGTSLDERRAWQERMELIRNALN